MNTLVDLKNQIQNFYSLEETQQHDILEQIKVYSHKSEQSNFIQEVHNHFPQNTVSGIDLIYEVLVKNQTDWWDFFFAEFKRAYESAQLDSSDQNTFSILMSLDELSFIDVSEAPFCNQLVDFLSSFLNHHRPVMRYCTVMFLADWLWEGNIYRYSHVVQKIVELLKDPNWKVRFIAKSTLAELNKLPVNFKLSFWDRLRAKTDSPYSF